VRSAVDAAVSGGSASPEEEPVNYPIDGFLDLHQFAPGDAKELVGDYLDACRGKGVLEVRIVHGKGTGTLRRVVHSVLAGRDDVESFKLAADASGWGATMVLLRRVQLLALLFLVSVLAMGAASCADDPAGDPAGDPADEPGAAAAVPSATTVPGAEAGEPEVTSLLGRPLFRPEISDDRRRELEADLNAARAEHEATPDDEDAIIWYGRRLAYLSRYRDAIDVYSRGLESHPDSFRLRRHRGHRYITTRNFDAAIADLSAAAGLVAGVPVEIEPDGAPGARNVPLSNTPFNIWYHLALAHYLKGDFEAARDAYLECMKFADNNDLLVATTDWLYMTYRRLGQEEEAETLLEAITVDMEIIENDSYHRRLLMYKGEVDPGELLDLRADDDSDAALQIATQGYGVASWYLVNGEVGEAAAVLARILEGTSWAAFGYIAAEADVQRRATQ